MGTISSNVGRGRRPGGCPRTRAVRDRRRPGRRGAGMARPRGRAACRQPGGPRPRLVRDPARGDARDPALRRRDAIAAWVAGAGAGGCVSARGGDAVRVLLLRRGVPRAGARCWRARWSPRARGSWRWARCWSRSPWPSASGPRSACRPPATCVVPVAALVLARAWSRSSRARAAAAADRARRRPRLRAAARAGRLRARRAALAAREPRLPARARWPASSPPSACPSRRRSCCWSCSPRAAPGSAVRARLRRRRGGDARRDLRARHRHRGAGRAARRVLRRHEHRADAGRHGARGGDLPADVAGRRWRARPRAGGARCRRRRAGARPAPGYAWPAWVAAAARAARPAAAWSAAPACRGRSRARGDDAGGDVEHVVVARRDHGERRSPGPTAARATLTAGLRTAAAIARPTATAKPTWRLGTAASSL